MVDPAILVAAINAAALVGTAAIQAAGGQTGKGKSKGKKKKFDSGALSVPPPDASGGGVPKWVWVAGGGVALLGLGFLVFGRKRAAAPEAAPEAA
jgi:hypothetical protein